MLATGPRAASRDGLLRFTPRPWPGGQTRLVRFGRPAVPLRPLCCAVQPELRLPAAARLHGFAVSKFSKPSAMPLPLRIAVAALLLAAAIAPPSSADEADDQYAVAAGSLCPGPLATGLRRVSDAADGPSDQRAESTGRVLQRRGAGAARSARRRAGAVRTIARTLAPRPLCSPAQFRRAEATYVLGRTARPALLEQFHAQYPDDPYDEFALPYLGELLLEEHEAEAAGKLFRQAARSVSAGRIGGRVPIGFGQGPAAARPARRGPAQLGELAAGQAAPAGDAKWPSKRSSSWANWKMPPANTRPRSGAGPLRRPSGR